MKFLDFSFLTKNIDRILEVNESLPNANKIRVISVSAEWVTAVKRAKKAGIFVVSSSIKDTFGYKFQGLGKQPMSDADNVESYKLGSFW